MQYKNAKNIEKTSGKRREALPDQAERVGFKELI
jgi:hypothetical protein